MIITSKARRHLCTPRSAAWLFIGPSPPHQHPAAMEKLADWAVCHQESPAVASPKAAGACHIR